MLMKQILEIYDILDSIYANGAAMEEYLRVIDPDADIDVYELKGENGDGKTDMIKIRIPGNQREDSRGRSANHRSSRASWGDRRKT